jgi:acetaldehyde dehydrogenase/alcohol dehydrogenase
VRVLRVACRIQVFYHVTPDPTLACINAGLAEILDFKPDVIIAMGGGSPMDAAKVHLLVAAQGLAEACLRAACRAQVLACAALSRSCVGVVSQIMWLMYECPETRFDGLAMRFMDIRKRVYEVPELGKKATMVCIPTTSGTGSEVTPFSVVTDERHGEKYPLAGGTVGGGWGDLGWEGAPWRVHELSQSHSAAPRPAHSAPLSEAVMWCGV